MLVLKSTIFLYNSESSILVYAILYGKGSSNRLWLHGYSLFPFFINGQYNIAVYITFWFMYIYIYIYINFIYYINAFFPYIELTQSFLAFVVM